MRSQAASKSSSVLRSSETGRPGAPRSACKHPLAFLPPKSVQEYARQQTIYSRDKPSDRLYAITLGRVAVSDMYADGRQAITRIVGQGGFFGESALVEPAEQHESAVALNPTGLMAWTRDEVEL